MQLFPSKRACLLVGLIALADALLVWLTPVDVSPGQLASTLLPIAGTALALVVVGFIRQRRAGAGSPLMQRLKALIGGLVFLQLAWLALRLFNHLSMATQIPYADAGLNAGDQALGLDWSAYFGFVLAHPLIAEILDASYTSLTPLSVLAFLLFMAMGEERRGRFFLETFLVTAAVCMALGLFFPARAAVAFTIGGPEMFAGMASPPGLYHLDHLERLRSGVPFTLDLRSMPGLVTFPSFHTAAGIVLAWSFRQTRLFAPVALYAALMIASTPVFGGHYFVDLIAGAFVAVAVLVPFQRSVAYRDLFATRALDPAPRLG